MSRGNPVQGGQPQLHLSSSVAPPNITNYNSTKNSANPTQNNFMQFSMNTITSPYAHGLV